MIIMKVYFLISNKLTKLVVLHVQQDRQIFRAKGNKCYLFLKICNFYDCCKIIVYFDDQVLQIMRRTIYRLLPLSLFGVLILKLDLSEVEDEQEIYTHMTKKE